MNLSFRSRDPLDDVIVNSATGTPVYQTQSHHLVHRVTQLSKLIPSAGRNQVIGEIHWENLSLHSAAVVYRGQKILIKDYLRKEGIWNIFTSTRAFSASDGNQYKWKFSNSNLKLTLYDSGGNVIAESHNKHHGILHKAQDYNIDILPPGMPITDDIILSFIIINHLEREKKKTENATIGGAIATTAS